jgi:hypothetical protein
MISRTVPSEARGDSKGTRRELFSEDHSRDLARSTARRSYSSQRWAVRVGVHGDVLRSLKCDVVLASGGGWCGADRKPGVAVLEAILGKL